ncbi:hypothetical protein CCR75_003239 [Bremia lactucae]|uniref:Uncharacterized protein n=1 Tax=Bremia lactucae TaxID=4779 RepID=A0A976IDX1_BRELC|nr:hypothetical protein CCR75_003239 [Bremia lactucae]
MLRHIHKLWSEFKASEEERKRFRGSVHGAVRGGVDKALTSPQAVCYDYCPDCEAADRHSKALGPTWLWHLTQI